MIETHDHPACRLCCRAVRVDGTPCRRKTAWSSKLPASGERFDTPGLTHLRETVGAKRFRPEAAAEARAR